MRSDLTVPYTLSNEPDPNSQDVSNVLAWLKLWGAKGTPTFYRIPQVIFEGAPFPNADPLYLSFSAQDPFPFLACWAMNDPLSVLSVLNTFQHLGLKIGQSGVGDDVSQYMPTPPPPPPPAPPIPKPDNPLGAEIKGTNLRAAASGDILPAGSLFLDPISGVTYRKYAYKIFSAVSQYWKPI